MRAKIQRLAGRLWQSSQRPLRHLRQGHHEEDVLGVEEDGEDLGALGMFRYERAVEQSC